MESSISFEQYLKGPYAKPMPGFFNRIKSVFMPPPVSYEVFFGKDTQMLPAGVVIAQDAPHAVQAFLGECGYTSCPCDVCVTAQQVMGQPYISPAKMQRDTTEAIRRWARNSPSPAACLKLLQVLSAQVASCHSLWAAPIDGKTFSVGAAVSDSLCDLTEWLENLTEEDDV